MIDSVTRQINKWWSNIMGKIRRGRAASRSNSSSSSSGGSVQGYAEGGYVQGPQLAVVGEGKSSEYIVPSHKMGGFINNYLSG